MANTFKFVGKIKPAKENGYEEKTFDSGWIRKTVSFSMLCGSTMQFLRAQGGKWEDDKKNVVYTMSKTAPGSKSTKMQIEWNKRLDASVVDSVAGFRRFVVDLRTEEEIKKCNDEDCEEDLTNVLAKKKEFIAEWDFVTYLNKLVNSEKIKDKVFSVSGNIEFSYSEKDDKYYVNYVPHRVSLVEPADNIVERSTARIDCYYSSDCVCDTLENGDVPVDVYTQFYNGFDKKNYFAPYYLLVKEDNPKKEGFVKLFSRIDKNAVKHINLDVDLINGSEKVDMKYEDLTEDQKEMIEYGLSTLEDIAKDIGGKIYGDRITENRILGVSRGSSGGAEETEYSKSDLTLKPYSEAQAKNSSKKDDSDMYDLFSNDEIEI